MSHVTLQVQGMSCGHCVKSVEDALKQAGAQGKVDLAKGTVDITFNEEKVTIEALKAAIEDQGYDVAG